MYRNFPLVRGCLINGVVSKLQCTQGHRELGSKGKEASNKKAPECGNKVRNVAYIAISPQLTTWYYDSQLFPNNKEICSCPRRTAMRSWMPDCKSLGAEPNAPEHVQSMAHADGPRGEIQTQKMNPSRRLAWNQIKSKTKYISKTLAKWHRKGPAQPQHISCAPTKAVQGGQSDIDSPSVVIDYRVVRRKFTHALGLSVATYKVRSASFGVAVDTSRGGILCKRDINADSWSTYIPSRTLDDRYCARPKSSSMHATTGLRQLGKYDKKVSALTLTP
ncbi:hypothetical protein B0H13DRAFT_1914423 [Mycena leptocephala]|nr:hypothetical protein B0H13DRAFT_1914423 [Mycena leptocephala]